MDKEEDRIKIYLLSPITGEFFPDKYGYGDDGCYGDGGEIWDGRILTSCADAISKKLQEYSQFGENGEACNLMDYFHGSASIRQKVESAFVSVTVKEGILTGCTTLTLNGLPEGDELREICDYITGQYSDGWGEGFEQQDIPVDGGYLNVHFWQEKDFDFERLYGIPQRPKDSRAEEHRGKEKSNDNCCGKRNKSCEIER